MTTQGIEKALQSAVAGGSDDLLRSIVESLPARIFWKDRDSRYLGCNTAFARDAGVASPADVVGKTDLEMVWKAEAEAYVQHDRAVMASGISLLDVEEPQTTPDGGTRWLSTSKVPLRAADGSIIGVIGIYEDITARKNAEVALKESEERNRSILGAAMDGFWLATTEGRILEVNEAYCRMSGYAREELLGRRIDEIDVTLVDPDPAVSPIVQKVLKAGEHRFETRHRKKDGALLDVEVSVQYRPEAKIQLVMFLRDITEQKRAAEALRASEERHRSIIETAMDGFWLCDRNGKLLEVNDAYCRMSGYSAEELLGMPISALKDPAMRDESPAHVRRAMEQGEARFETRHRRKDGTLFDLEVSMQYREGDGGQSVAFQRDITERKRAEEALRMSEERYRSILIASPDNIIITDLSARVIMVSPMGLATMGYEAEQAVGRSLFDFVVEEDRARAQEHVTLMFQGIRKGPEEYRGIRADGSLIDIEVNAEFIRGADGEPRQLVFISRDVTERKRAQAELEGSEARHRTILQTAMDGVWVVDDEGRIVDVNEAYCRMSGYSLAELLTMKVSQLSMLDRREEEAAAHIRAIMEAGSARFESEHRRKDGTLFRVEASVRFLPIEGGRLVGFLRDTTEQKKAVAALQESHDMITKLTAQVPGVVYQYRLYPDGRSCFPFASSGMHTIYEVAPEDVREDATPVFGRLHPDERESVTALILDSARTLEPFHCEFRVVLPRQGLRWRLCDAMPSRTEDGGTLWYGIISDITERKHAEEQLRLSLKEKESLLREVHHRVKNNLQVISSLLRLESSRSEAENTRHVLHDMQGRILSMAVLHETLYRSGLFGQVDLAGYLKQLAQQLVRATSTAVDLRLELSPVSVEIDQAIPCGLILNELLTNCVKHAFTGREAGEVRVVVAQDSAGEVHLGVTDTGAGLPLDFEAKRGRSLGLQLVGDLVRQIGGHLAIDPGPGASFLITFTPAATHSAPHIPR